MFLAKIRLSSVSELTFTTLVIGGLGTLCAQDTAAAGRSSELQGAIGVGIPNFNPPFQLNTGVWSNVLTSTYDSTGAGTKGLIINTSAVTAIVTGDFTTSQSFLLDWGGLQARVLVDCFAPACDTASDAIPPANLAAPGVIFLDQQVHALFNATSADQIQIAIDLAAGARAFNFFVPTLNKTPLGPNIHTVQWQVKFNAGGLNYQSFSGAVVAIAKRTMIVSTAKITQLP